MSLFPAYATTVKDVADIPDTMDSQDMAWEASESREAQLLTSDVEEETPALAAPRSDSFYLDSKFEPGNLRVSTLYYPGRPQYDRRGGAVWGAWRRRRCVDEEDEEGGVGGKRAQRKRRYWARRAADAAEALESTRERALSYRRLLLERPQDVSLWERFIDFQEVCSGPESALAAAEEAAERVPGSQRLRERLLVAARAALPREQLLQRLRDMLARERNGARRAVLWVHLMGLAAAEGAEAVRAAAAAALHDTRMHPLAYPRLLHTYGVFLRSAGLWEELVLLVELLTTITCAPADFPPRSLEDTSVAESRLLELEDQALSSGLPLGAVWVRVERARATVHWRAVAQGADAGGDPQRSPPPARLAELLRPVVGARAALLLAVAVLRLAKVPLLPGAGWMAHAFGAPEADCAEALLPLLRAARRLPAAHPAHAAPPAARALLALLLDPPHYFTDDAGYLSWVVALWDACCAWLTGERRVALLCWRLRWLHALTLLVDPREEIGAREVGRMREEARSALRRFADGSPLAFAEFARIEREASGPERAGLVALRALRAALVDGASPRAHALHIARIVCEVSARDEPGALGTCALVCAVRGRAPPELVEAPAPEEVAAALQICEERCEELERRFGEQTEETDEAEAGEEEEAESEAELRALLPDEAEWAAARALLAPPARREELLRAQLAACSGGGCACASGAAGARYCEQAACALLARPASRAAAAARALALHHPHSAYLTIAGAGAPLWAWRELGHEERLRALGAARAPAAALAAPLPAMLRALAARWRPPEAEACARALRRREDLAGYAGHAGGALLEAARLEAEGRAPCPRLPRALYAALERAPAAKWLYVRGAAWCGGEAGALADLLLHRQLRTHALLDELAVLTTPAAAPTAELPAASPAAPPIAPPAAPPIDPPAASPIAPPAAPPATCNAVAV